MWDSVRLYIILSVTLPDLRWKYRHNHAGHQTFPFSRIDEAYSLFDNKAYRVIKVAIIYILVFILIIYIHIESTYYSKLLFIIGEKLIEIQ